MTYTRARGESGRGEIRHHSPSGGESYSIDIAEIIRIFATFAVFATHGILILRWGRSENREYPGDEGKMPAVPWRSGTIRWIGFLHDYAREGSRGMVDEARRFL